MTDLATTEPAPEPALDLLDPDVGVSAKPKPKPKPRPGAGGGEDPGLEGFRAELTSHCRRMLDCPVEAEDAAQETLVRAWQGFARFEGRASLRSWLYRIATNVCLDMLQSPQRRPVPADLTCSMPAVTALERSGPAARVDGRWPSATANGGLRSEADDPADAVVSGETIRLAFVVALQRLPARQRAVLILREVLRWRASEVATLLGITTPAVNSLLQRARSTLATNHPAGSDQAKPLASVDRSLLDRYVDAFQGHDVDSLVALLQSPN